MLGLSHYESTFRNGKVIGQKKDDGLFLESLCIKTPAFCHKKT